jgi:CO/xanthine dehydrogenase Mo-binding subunit
MGVEPKELKWVGKRIIRPDGVDKVTGRANFGADLSLPGMLTGAILRSPHAHARIKSIDTSKAEALPGVKSIATHADFDQDSIGKNLGGQTNFAHLSQNVLASDKVFYDGHAIVAVAATSAAIANEAISLIKVDYEILPHVLDVVEAVKPEAPLLHEGLITAGVEPKPEKASNVASRVQFGIGDVEKGFAEADRVFEGNYKTEPVHQGYIEPHAVVADVTEDGQSRVWCSSQGHFMIRSMCAKLLGWENSRIRVTPAEIGGGFGGKTLVYLEPVALILSKKAGRPVRLVMSRADVFRGTGPTSGSVMNVKIGMKKDGTMTAGEATLNFMAGGFPGSPVGAGAMTAFACYDIPHTKIVGYDVCVNRPKVAAYRAPGAPNSAFAVECLIDEIADDMSIDPIELRLKNAAKEGTQAPYGPKFKRIGFVETLDAAKNCQQYAEKLGPNQGRGVASGFWFNIGGESSAAVNINEDGTAVVISSNPDIGGSRASLALMAAETLGLDVDKIQVLVADTATVGYSDPTGGSRVTFATGKAVMAAAEMVVEDMRGRAAQIWDVDKEGVDWQDGAAYPASTNVGEFEPLTIADIAAQTAKTGGPITGKASLNARGAGPGFGTHVCDVEVDPDTGYVTVLRYTVVQDAGKAVHPGYVEGQMQGGVAQGVGWALNEEYIYDDQGRLENPGFLDYRMPVTSDLPMIEPIVVEVPNPGHPYGVRGVGEVPIVPPLAAVANAVSHAIDRRMTALPMSPPKIVEAIENGK